MTLKEVFNALGTKRKSEVARVLGISKQAVNTWGLDDPIPELRAKQLKYEILPDLEKTAGAKK